MQVEGEGEKIEVFMPLIFQEWNHLIERFIMAFKIIKLRPEKPKIYYVEGFEYGYIRSPKDICGTMHPFRPHWWIQYLGNGQSTICNTKAECLAWIKEMEEITQ